MPLVKSLFFHIKSPPPRPNPSSQFTTGLGKSTAGWGNLPGENLLLPARETLGYTIGEKQYIVSMHNWENRRLLGEICQYMGKCPTAWGNLLLGKSASAGKNNCFLGKSTAIPWEFYLSSWYLFYLGYTLIRWGIPYYRLLYSVYTVVLTINW